MPQRPPNPSLRYWPLTVIWVAAFGIAAVLAERGERVLLVPQIALVGTFLWFTVGRYPGSERLAVHLVFCLMALPPYDIDQVLMSLQLTTADEMRRISAGI